MKPSRLFVAAGVALAVLAGYNVLISHTARTSQRQRARAAIEQIPSTTEFVFLGNSLVEAGCDAGAFSAAWSNRATVPPAVNLGLGATTPVEHYLILERAFQRNVRPKFLIYGFFDDQLNAPVTGEWSDLVGNRALSYYFPEKAADLYEPSSRLKRWELTLTQQVPMLAERSSLWTQVELLRREMEGVGMPAQKINRFGRVDDFEALVAKDLESFNRRCAKVVAEQIGFSRPVREIARLAREHGTKLILVEMPMPSRHRNTFYSSPIWPKMREHLQALAAAEGAIYVTASDWVGDDTKFEDATHLNEEGAKFFSAKLAAAVARLDVAAVAMGRGE